MKTKIIITFIYMTFCTHALFGMQEDDSSFNLQPYDTPAVLKAVIDDKPDQLSQLLLAGSDVNATNLQKETALHIATRYNRVACLSILLQHPSIQILQRDQFGKCPLQIAAENDTSVLPILMNGYKHIPVFINLDFNFALMGAVKNNQHRNAMLLLESGGCSHPDSILDDGKTILDIAAQNNSQFAVELLLRHHAAPFNFEPGKEPGPIKFTTNPEVFALLLNSYEDNKRGRTLLHTAALLCPIANFAKLLTKFGPINVDIPTRFFHQTPLHFAVEFAACTRENSTNNIMWLLNAGANVNAQDINGSTPLKKATQLNHVEAVRLLLTHNANPTIKDNSGKKPLHYATDQKIIKLLLQAEGNTECPICSSKWDTAVTVTQCGHAFCYDCLIDWIRVNLTCPTCRTNL